MFEFNSFGLISKWHSTLLKTVKLSDADRAGRQFSLQELTEDPVNLWTDVGSAWGAQARFPLSYINSLLRYGLL